MWVWLSYVLSERTPGYAGNQGFWVEADKQLCCGDSCNSKTIKMSNHIGSHVDAPLHFIANGKATEHYSPDEWIFERVIILDVAVGLGEVVTPECVAPLITNVDDADLVLFCTGFGEIRDQDNYWKHPPAYDPKLALFLKDKLPSIKAIGMDSISLSSLDHREMGREAHKEFLGNNIRIFEDLDFSTLSKHAIIQQVIALPIRFENSDGAQCTIMASINSMDK